MKYRKIVFLLGTHRKHPVLYFDYLSIIRSYNVEFEVWDIRSFNPLWNGAQDTMEIMEGEYGYKFISNFKELEQQLSENNPLEVIVHINLELKFWLRKILRTISDFGFNYFLRSNQCCLYGDLDKKVYMQGWKFFKWKAALRYYLKLVLKVFLKKIIRFNLLSPEFIFIGDNYDKILLEFYPQSKTQYIYTHVNDFERFIEFSEKPPTKLFNSKYAVFIDQFYGFHFEHRYLKKPFDKEIYYRKIQTFLKRLKSELNLDVVIALHPGADPDLLKPYYGDFPLVRSKTAELVYHAAFVLAHDSSSISFSILFKKPITILMTRELAGLSMEIYIKSVAKLLDKTPIFVEDPLSVSQIDFSVNSLLYEEIQDRCLKMKGSPMKYEWNIIMEYLQSKDISIKKTSF